MPKPSQPVKKWGYVFFEMNHVAPAADFLERLRSTVRERLFDAIDAVLLTNNPPRAYLPNRWHSMRHAEGIDMGDYFEARDQHDDTNYRLFCRFDSAAESVLGAPVLVLLGGAQKPARTVMHTREYQAIRDAWNQYNRPHRRCSAVSFPPVRIPPSPRGRS